MEQIVYDGKIKIARTKWGLFVRGKPEEVSDVEANEILKLQDFHKASFTARFMGKGKPRSIRVGSKIFVCPVGKWTKLPLSVMYKIRASKEFEMAGEKITPLEPKKIEKPTEVKKVRKRKSKAKKRVVKPIPKITKRVEPEEEPSEFTEEEMIGKNTIESLGLPYSAVKALEKAGIKSLDQLETMTDENLLSISGIGPASLEKIRGG